MDAYLPIRLNFQGIDGQWHKTDGAFANMFAGQLEKTIRAIDTQLADLVKQLIPGIQNMDALSDAISQLANGSDKKMVLLIDEVDASSHFTSFLNFLGMLRTKYLDRFAIHHATFHSIVLAGVHDIKTLKSKSTLNAGSSVQQPLEYCLRFQSGYEF